LHETNTALEAIAQAIFKSWFVDFDPVKAKAEGREPEGMDAATAALFPSEFEDSPLGPIPSGWKVAELSEFIALNPLRSLKKNSVATYLDMAKIPTSGHRASAWASRAFSSGSRFRNGDTLLARITPCLENGKTAFVDFLEDGEVGWGSTEFIVMAPQAKVPPEFAYLLARSPGFRQHAIQSMSGTSGRQRVQTDQLAKFKMAIPSEPIFEAFGRLVEPLFRGMKSRAEQQATLAAIRDALLPKLMSGQIRLPLEENKSTEVA
jgi:type I restriction enzyme, S subunit